MTPDRGHRVRLALVAAFVVLVFVGALAMAMNGRTTSGGGILPPLPEQVASEKAGEVSSRAQQGVAPTSGEEAHRHEEELAVPLPAGAASLAGPPASVVRRFAQRWANRNVLLTPAIKREMVGLTAGSLASAVAQQARLTLPAIEGVEADGRFVMMKLSSEAPRSKTALVVTRERLLGPDGELAPPRYEIYLANLDRISPRGYAITAWEPQR
jgi:hypothetical protein